MAIPPKADPKLFNPATRGITINTDASFCPETKAGGWAVYIVCDDFKIQKSGKFRGTMKSALEAEMKAIGNALVILLLKKEVPRFHFVYVNTDCKNAIRDIEGSTTPLGKRINGYWTTLNTRTSSRLKKFRHVKAHSNVADSRSFVNDWCDKEAKRCMRIRREEIKKLIKK